MDEILDAHVSYAKAADGAMDKIPRPAVEDGSAKISISGNTEETLWE